jgi:uncharacterized peroxidase-related enzyme
MAHDISVSYFPAGDEEALAPELRELYARCRERLGFVPNVFQAFQWRPERLRAWLSHYDAVMTPTETLPAAEREMIAVTVSMLNGCGYCLVSHGFAVRKALKDPVVGDLVTLDHRRAPLTPRQHAMLRFAEKITRTPLECSQADLDELRGHGLSDEDCWDVVEVAALFNFTNRLALATGMVPNPEYHGMAR